MKTLHKITNVTEFPKAVRRLVLRSFSVGGSLSTLKFLLWRRRITNMAVIFMVIGAMVCSNLAYSSETLRLQVGRQDTFSRIRKIITKDKKEAFIELIDPDRYWEYSSILLDIVEEEKQISKKSGHITKDASLTIREFKHMRNNVHLAGLGLGGFDIVALFIATDINGEVIGAEELRTEVIRELELEAVRGSVAVRQEYQDKGIGTALRETAFKWMINEGYDKYVVLMLPDNKKSLKSLENVCDNLGLTRPQPMGKFINMSKVRDDLHLALPTDEFINMSFGPAQYYLIDLNNRNVIEFCNGEIDIENLGKSELIFSIREIESARLGPESPLRKEILKALQTSYSPKQYDFFFTLQDLLLNSLSYQLEPKKPVSIKMEKFKNGKLVKVSIRQSSSPKRCRDELEKDERGFNIDGPSYLMDKVKRKKVFGVASYGFGLGFVGSLMKETTISLIYKIGTEEPFPIETIFYVSVKESEVKPLDERITSNAPQIGL